MGRQQVQPVWTSSPCIGTIRNELCGRLCSGVLDLGQAQGSLMNFYASFTHRTHVVDAFSALGTNQVDQEFSWDGHLPSEEKGFGLVAAWDLPNYLPLDRLVELHRFLMHRMYEGSLLYFVIGCHQTIPRLPWKFSLGENDQLLWEPTSTDSQECPQYLTGELLDALPGFRRLRSCLLSNGYQEYLFVRQ